MNNKDMKGNIMNITNYKIKRATTNFIFLLILAWFLFVTRVLFAQPEILTGNMGKALQEELLSGINPDTIRIDTEKVIKPYLGIVFGRDLDFEKAMDLHYPYTYGAYINEIDKGGPADRAGLQEGDIITRFGNDKIRYNEHFIRIVENYNAGDIVPVILFREENIMKTSITLDAAPEQKYVELDEPDFTMELNFPTKKKPHLVESSQAGIIAWDFIFYAPDNLELYDDFLSTQLGYSSLLEGRRMNDKNYSGLNMNGFHLKPGEQDGSINWGIFWASNNWNRQKPITYNSEDFTRNMVHSINYWGLTLDKQITIFNHVLLSAGVLAGRLTSGLEFYQTESLDSWNDIGVQLSSNEQNYLSVEKKYLLVQPNVSLMIPVLGDIGIQVKLGYFYGIPQSNGWKVTSLDGEKSVIDSPNSSVGGYTVSIGPAIILK
ncbi:MAG: PDZ domain-containing protein [Candidatus Marinimicrobia bacterium]|nr:PDZ domain-containing protein [Candidatus Neomarinimicrobiota bacterium]